MASHLDPDALADFREGLLGRRRSARIRAHLDSCPTCASLDQDLAQVTELLASAPAPPMPDHLVTRLENALAAEAARVANPDHPGAADVPPGAAGHTDRRPRRTSGRSWQRRPAMLGVAAAIAAILAVGGYGLAILHQGPGSAASSTDLGPAHRAAGKGREPGAANLPGTGVAIPGPLTAQLQVIESRTDYIPSRLASQARAVLASHPITPQARPNASSLPADGTAGEPARDAQLQSCVRLTTGGLGPLLIDEALYQGQPATIIILPAKTGQAGQVWVTEPNCTATNRALFAHAQLATG